MRPIEPTVHGVPWLVNRVGAPAALGHEQSAVGNKMRWIRYAYWSGATVSRAKGPSSVPDSSGMRGASH